MLQIKSKKRAAILTGTWLFWSALIAGLLTVPAITMRLTSLASLLITTDLQLQDRLINTTPPLLPDDDIVFLGIDESTLTVGEDDPRVIAQSPALSLMAGPFPWSREVWALTIERLLDSGARLVILDLLVNSPREGDEALREVIERYPGKIVLASNLTDPANSQGISGLGTNQPPSESILPEALEESVPVGFVNFWNDLDGKVRRVRFQETVEAAANLPDHPASTVYPSMVAETLRAMGEAPPLTESRGSYVLHHVSNLTSAYAPKPLYEIFWPSTWRQNFQNGEFFRDKIVMIGPSAVQLQDRHPTPVGVVVGPLLHLNALTSTRQNALFQSLEPRVEAVIIFVAGFFAFLIVGLLRRPLIAIAGLILLAIAYLFMARAFLESGYLLGLLGPLLGIFSVGSTGIVYDYSRVFRERLLLRRALERRVSGEVLKEILENPSSYLNQLGGVRKTVTILFSDLRGFTKMSENAVPEEMVARLNAYFDLMVGRIQEQRGMVDKFIGDAIMAVWGSVPSQAPEESVAQAVQAALRMCHELETLNQRWNELAEKESVPPVQWAMGIGLHCGDAITGNIGSEKRLELTVIGDAVNLASRLEGVTKPYGVPIIVSETVAGYLEGQPDWILRPLDRVRVVGRRNAVTLFQPLYSPDLSASDHPPSPMAQAAEAFSAAFETYLARDFAKAASDYAALLEKFPNDVPTRKLLDRSKEFIDTPPPEDWGGGITLDSK